MGSVNFWGFSRGGIKSDLHMKGAGSSSNCLRIEKNGWQPIQNFTETVDPQSSHFSRREKCFGRSDDRVVLLAVWGQWRPGVSAHGRELFLEGTAFIEFTAMVETWSWAKVDTLWRSCVGVSLSQRAVAMAASVSLQEDQAKQKQRIEASKLYLDVPPDEKDPVVYSSSYNISFLGLEKLHPFDASKWGHIQKYLADDGVLKKKRIVEPVEASRDDLLVVHTEKYIDSLKSSFVVAQITEVQPLALLPNFLVQWKVLQPFRKQVGGTILTAKLAKERGWAINIGGGFHHCCANEGGGFCAYADITLAIQFAYTRLAITRVMIIDLDAHQGNGHARDFMNDDRVYIIDLYNSDIYPWDFEAKKRINQPVALKSGTTTDKYLALLRQELKKAATIFKPELVVYNAGTDVLAGDPLGRLLVSPEGVKQRDEMVFQFAKDQNAPVIMLTSGGYMKTSARVIADSITNLAAKRLISLPSDAPEVTF